MNQTDDKIKEALEAMKADRVWGGSNGFSHGPMRPVERWLRHLLSEIDRMGRANDDLCDKVYGLGLEVARLKDELARPYPAEEASDD